MNCGIWECSLTNKTGQETIEIPLPEKKVWISNCGCSTVLFLECTFLEKTGQKQRGTYFERKLLISKQDLLHLMAVIKCTEYDALGMSPGMGYTVKEQAAQCTEAHPRLLYWEIPTPRLCFRHLQCRVPRKVSYEEQIPR